MQIRTAIPGLHLPARSLATRPQAADDAPPRDTVQLTPLAHRRKLRPYVVGGLVLGAVAGSVGSLPGALFLGSLGAVVGLAVGSMLVKD